MFYGPQAFAVSGSFERFQDLDIEVKCLITRITTSPSARLASELLKDCQALVPKIEKITKLYKKIICDSKELTQDSMKTLKAACASIDASYTEIT